MADIDEERFQMLMELVNNEHSDLNPLKRKDLPHSNRQTGREQRHVLCFVEKAGLEPRTLGTEAERAANCATRPLLYGHMHPPIY
jgi:hypothetical protein